jgi:AAA domain
MYDEAFHDGINIIHGGNGSGKSTITDFIYFALGGDLKEWREEAQLADYVLAEITTAEAVITIKREVSEQIGRPMHVFFGSYVDSLAADIRNWLQFPYKRPEDGYSFSQVLFKAIGIPEAISDGVSNITMHQLLRVLYSDQLTPVQRIFRVESFDTWQTRQAVGDLLCGLGGYDIYSLQLNLRELDKTFTEVSARLKSLMTVASSYGDELLLEQVAKAMQKAQADQGELQAKLSQLLQHAEEASTSSEADKLVKRRRRDLAKAKLAVSKLTDTIETLEYEQVDAEHFIDHLRAAVEDFEDASNTFFALGAVRFEFCPSCFAPISGSSDHERTHCHLCNTPSVEGHDETRALAVRLDLEMQIKESLEIQRERSQELVKLQNELRAATSNLRAIANASEADRNSAASKFDTVLAETSRQIGYLDREIEQLGKRETLAREIAALSEEKSLLNAKISELKDQIVAAETSQNTRKRTAYTLIAERLKQTLARDLSEHSDFDNIETVSFSFAEDWIAINGNKNRVGSASGMVVLKNSFLLSLFATSLVDQEFNLPRFLLMDNIEDKGMVQERSWNFQRLIVETSTAAQAKHQIIFSTSKIAPELRDSPMVVGGEYTKLRRTLKIQSAIVR